MSEQEHMDQLLRATLGAAPPPTLSPAFDQRLAKRLRARRLTPNGRRVLIAYTLVTLAASVGLMRSQDIGWSLIALAVLVPLAATAIVHRRGSIRAS